MLDQLGDVTPTMPCIHVGDSRFEEGQGLFTTSCGFLSVFAVLDSRLDALEQFKSD